MVIIMHIYVPSFISTAHITNMIRIHCNYHSELTSFWLALRRRSWKRERGNGVTEPPYTYRFAPSGDPTELRGPAVEVDESRIIHLFSLFKSCQQANHIKESLHLSTQNRARITVASGIAQRFSLLFHGHKKKNWSAQTDSASISWWFPMEKDSPEVLYICLSASLHTVKFESLAFLWNKTLLMIPITLR